MIRQTHAVKFRNESRPRGDILSYAIIIPVIFVLTIQWKIHCRYVCDKILIKNNKIMYTPPEYLITCCSNRNRQTVWRKVTRKEAWELEFAIRPSVAGVVQIVLIRHNDVMYIHSYISHWIEFELFALPDDWHLKFPVIAITFNVILILTSIYYLFVLILRPFFIALIHRIVVSPRKWINLNKTYLYLFIGI